MIRQRRRATQTPPGDEHSRGARGGGKTINGKPFPTQGAGPDPGSGRIVITIDATGVITVADPTTKVPQADPPGKK